MIEQGPDKGREIRIPPDGARLGRSSKNDIIVSDPILSRHHCRFFFQDDGTLGVTDLGSSNQTMVNNDPITEKVLNVGDTISVGDTLIRVLNNKMKEGSITAAPPEQDDLPQATDTDTPEPVVDLGFAGEKERPQRKKIGLFPLFIIGLIVTGAALAVWIPKLIKPSDNGDTKPPEVKRPTRIELRYEKVEADADNIFRYELVINKDREMSVTQDSLKDNIKLRERAVADTNQIIELISTFIDSSFFSLDPSYEGVQPSQHYLSDITVTIGKQTHRVKILNYPEPPIFEEVREEIERLAKFYFGEITTTMSRDDLIKNAMESLSVAENFLSRINVDYGNLAKAIENLSFAEMYLKTVEPKPDFYADILALSSSSKDELEKRYKDVEFRVIKSYRIKEWKQAAEDLRIILEMIPNESDPRHKDAYKKLLEVERLMQDN